MDAIGKIGQNSQLAQLMENKGATQAPQTSQGVENATGTQEAAQGAGAPPPPPQGQPMPVESTQMSAEAQDSLSGEQQQGQINDLQSLLSGLQQK